MKLIDVCMPLGMGIVGLGAALTLGGGFGHQFAVLGVGVGLFATGFGLVATKLHRAWEQQHDHFELTQKFSVLKHFQIFK